MAAFWTFPHWIVPFVLVPPYPLEQPLVHHRLAVAVVTQPIVPVVAVELRVAIAAPPAEARLGRVMDAAGNAVAADDEHRGVGVVADDAGHLVHLLWGRWWSRTTHQPVRLNRRPVGGRTTYDLRARVLFRLR